MLPTQILRKLLNALLLSLVFSGLITRVCADDSDTHYEWFENDDGGKWGLKDSQTGKIIFPARFTGGTGRREGERLGTELHNGKAWVFEGKKIKLIDVHGSVLAQVEGDMIQPWNDDLFKIQTPSGYGLFSDSGKTVLPAHFYQIDGLSDGRAMIGIQAPGVPSSSARFLYGYIDDKGSIVIPPTFVMADPFSEGVARVCDNGYHFIDKNGNIAFTLATSLAYPFSDGLSAAYTQDTGWGFIDKTGQFVVQPRIRGCLLLFQERARLGRCTK